MVANNFAASARGAKGMPERVRKPTRGMEFVGQIPGDHQETGGKPFAFLLGGCVLGGITFVLLNEALNSSGGYLRKMSTTITYINHSRFLRYSGLLKKMGNMRIFRSIPSGHIQNLIKYGRKENSSIKMFKMTDEIDKGEIIDVAPISLLGSLEEIVIRQTEVMREMIDDYIHSN